MEQLRDQLTKHVHYFGNRLIDCCFVVTAVKQQQTNLCLHFDALHLFRTLFDIGQHASKKLRVLVVQRLLQELPHSADELQRLFEYLSMFFDISKGDVETRLQLSNNFNKFRIDVDQVVQVNTLVQLVTVPQHGKHFKCWHMKELDVGFAHFNDALENNLQEGLDDVRSGRVEVNDTMLLVSLDSYPW